MVCAVALGWLVEDEEEMQGLVSNLFPCLSEEERCAAHFMAGLLYALRHGATKNDAALIGDFGSFRSYTKDVHWKTAEGPLGILVRAWSAFYDAFDFTSSMHHAMHLPGDVFVNGMFAGALAEAMYGCGQVLLKKKYSGNVVVFSLPPLVARQFGDAWHKIGHHIWVNRVFFPKNNARTNVERHEWRPVENPYRGKQVDAELRHRILKAVYTGWENRYGFYLDDGWVYVYRSFVLLCRFQLRKETDGTYRISKLQTSGEKDGATTIRALREALHSIE